VTRLEGVRSCAWSPDGTRLASGSDNTTVRVWLAPPVTLAHVGPWAQAAAAAHAAPPVALAHVGRWAEAAAAAYAEQARVAAERSALDLAAANTRAAAADTRARRLGGDHEALHQCSLEVETHRYCQPRHRMALNSRNRGPKCVSIDVAGII